MIKNINIFCADFNITASLYNKLPRPGKTNYIYKARVFKISQNDKLLSENDKTTVKWQLCIQLHKMRYNFVIHLISNIACIQL